MQLFFDETRKRIICTWGEPTSVVMRGAEGTIFKTKTMSCLISKRGRMSETDRKRLQGRPQFKHIARFWKKLLAQNFFPLKENFRICEVCGANEAVFAHFDPDTSEIVYLCREHQRALKPMAESRSRAKGRRGSSQSAVTPAPKPAGKPAEAVN